MGAAIVLARSQDATFAYIADEDARAIRVVDLDRRDELGVFELGGKPSQLVILDDFRFAVTLRDRDEVVILAGLGIPAAPFVIEQHIAVPSEPVGLALTPDDRTLLLTSGWGHTLTALDVPCGFALAGQWAVAPEPRGVVSTDDGKYAYVSHAVGQHLERVDLGSGTIDAIALSGTEEIGGRHQSVGERPRVACQGFALAASIAPAGRIYAPGVQVFAGGRNVTSQGYGADSEGMEPEMFDVAVVDEDAGTMLGESLALRFVARDGPCVLPRAAAVSAGGSLFVSCLGANVVVELDGASVAPANAELRRWDVPAGPIGIALDDAHDRAIVWSQLAHTVTELATHGPTTLHTLVLDDAPPTEVAHGRELFVAVDARISNDGRACESCHPEGRQDTLVWSTPLGPRQAPMLAGRVADTAPYGWNGDAIDLAHHLTKTLSRLHGKGLDPADRSALIAYLTTLAPPPRSELTDALVAEGEEIFRSAEAQCASCHGDDGRSPDRARHNVSSRIEGDQRSEFDTPSLAFVAGTAPYYHDGRFATLRELLVKTRGKMGQKRELAEHELDALEAYLRSR